MNNVLTGLVIFTKKVDNESYCKKKANDGMKITIWNHLNSTITLFFFIVMIGLQGCASSDAARGAAGEADKAYLQTDYSVRHATDSGISETYQNTSQLTKGVVIGGLVGAATGSVTPAMGSLAGFGLGVIIGGALGKYIDSHTTMADKLENRHVQVIILGDQVLIVLPSSLLFYQNTPNIRADAYETLVLISQLIGSYPNMSVKVTAYTSAAIPDSVAFSLSEKQAQNVAKYLWQTDINTRLLYAEGGGGSKLVTANIADWSSDNYRVEITLEKLPV